MKKCRKKYIISIIAMLIAACMIGTSIPITALAEESQTGDGVNYYIVSTDSDASGDAIKAEIVSDILADIESEGLDIQEPVEEEQNIDVLTTEDTAGTGDTTAEDDVITRVEWLHELTTLFEMTVEETNYPDNYFTDIDSSSEYYHDIMLATEFGLIDVEAGDPVYPDDPATREFAAHTLNYCLGYTWEGTEEYTYAEYAEVSYPNDIQIAVNHGWFELVNGAFVPEQAITSAEKEIMLTAAKAAQDETIIQEDYNSTYEFVEGVIVLPEETTVLMTNDDELTITDCPVELKEGDIFAVVAGGFPAAYQVAGLTESGNETIVQIQSVDTQDAFVSIDIQGVGEADLSQIQVFSEEVELNYIVGGTAEENWEDGVTYDTVEEVGSQAIDAVEVVQSYDIPDALREKYEIADGVKAEIVCKISDVKPSHKITAKKAYFDVSAKITFSCNVEKELLEELDIVPSYQLAYVPIGHIGYFKISLDMSINGKVTLNLEEKVKVGIQFDGNGFRAIKEFKKASFTLQAKAEVSVGVKAQIGINCGILKGAIYLRMGATASIQATVYTDGKSPTNCIHTDAWLYTVVGYEVKVNLLFTSIKWGDEKELFAKYNSPVRLQYHYEDGVPVPQCTRDGEESGDSGDDSSGSDSGSSSSGKKYKYYTPITSQYGYSGANTGVDAEGNTYTIFDYDLDEDGNATITSYKGNVSALNIPETLDGHTVVGIGNKVFQNNTKLRIVNIPDSVTSIGLYAFAYCSNLATVKLSKGLTKIGYSAFRDCDSLVSIELPKSLEEVDINYGSDAQSGVFNYCDNLKEVTFENGIVTIANDLFHNCTGIEKIKIPDTVTQIEKNAFEGCSNLTEVTISDSVTSIGIYAFAYCSNLSSVKLSKGLTKIGYSAFRDCDSLVRIEIPKNLEEVDINYGSDALDKGATETLTITVLPEDATDKTIIWSSSDTEVATVEAGKVTAIKAGTATITATSHNGKTAECVITVVVPVAELQLDKEAVTLEKGATETLIVTVLPEDATDKTVTWSSSDTDVITVEEGKLTAVEAGTATITVTSSNGKIATCEVTVIISVTELKLDKETITLDKGATETLTVTVLPEDATDKTITWSSSDTEVATVEAGKVTAIKAGTATITATSHNGKTAECVITVVVVPVAELQLDKEAVTLEKGATEMLIVTVMPEDATDKTVTWSSSDDKVVTVEEGKLTAVETGTATITVTASNGITATCKVTVNAEISDVDNTSWQFVPVQFVYVRGLMTGKGSDASGKAVFAPNENLTREQFAQILYSAENKPDVTYNDRFPDVPDGQWYTQAVIWAAEKGIVSGYANGMYGVGDEITREQLAAMLFKYAEYKQYDTSERASFEKFNDTDKISSWATNQLSWAVAQGIMNGKGEGLDPIGDATRAECATMLKAFIVIYEEKQ